MFRSILKSSDVHVTKVVLDPLNDATNKNAIETLLQLIRSSIGPYGKLKIIRNAAGGHASVTSSSLRLFNILSIKNLFLKVIIASVKSHVSFYEDGGLSCALLTLLLLKRSLVSSLKGPLIAKLNDWLGGIYLNLIQSPDNHCVFNVSLSKISHLYCIVHSIVSSKPGCFFTEEDKKDLTLMLLKTFLNSVSSKGEKNVHVMNIMFSVAEGLNPSDSKFLNGLLISQPDTVYKLCVNHCIDTVNSTKRLKVALFSTSLAGDAHFPSVTHIESNISIWNSVLSHLQIVVDKIIENGVHILFCQKVVHPAVIKKLQDNCILVIHRLGAETTQYIHLLSGAVPVTSLAETLDVTYGFLDSVENFDIGKKKFFLFQNHSRPLGTVLVCNLNEEAAAETKVVFKQAISTLYHLLKDPRVCCGAGCTEIYTLHLLENVVVEKLSEWCTELDCSSHQLLLVYRNFKSSVQDLVSAFYQKSKLSLASENVYGHLWEVDEGNDPTNILKCKCGMHDSSHIRPSQWRYLDNVCSAEAIVNSDVKELLCGDLATDEPKIIDQLCVKIGALKTAFDVSSSLLRIGLTVTPQNHAVDAK